MDFLKELERQSKANELNEVSTDISKTYLWVLCALGIPGNIFTIITIRRMGKMTPATFFVALLAACDGCALIAKLIGNQLHVHKVFLGDAGCKLEFIPAFLSTMANWALVLIALERFFSVCYPLKKMGMFTKRRSYIITSVIFVTLLVIYAVVYGVLYISVKAGRDCGTKKSFMKFFTSGWYYINASLFLFIPFIINMALTILIIRGLVRSRRDRRSIFRNGSKEESGRGYDNNRKLLQESERAERMITIMLILVSILFLILTLPGGVYYLTYQKSSDSLIAARWQLFNQIQYVLVDSTHAINFFLYFISAKRFRHYFISMLTCKRWPKVKSRIQSNTTESSKLSTTQCSMNRLDRLDGGSRDNLTSVD